MTSRDSIVKFIQRKAVLLFFLGCLLLLLSAVDFVPLGRDPADQEKALLKEQKILEDWEQCQRKPKSPSEAYPKSGVRIER